MGRAARRGPPAPSYFRSHLSLALLSPTKGCAVRRFPTLSVVVPIYNEEAVLPSFAERLRPVLDGIGEPYEVVAVDDSSRDATPLVLAGMRRSWPELRVIR